MGLLLIATQLIYAEESRRFEKLAEVLPVEESGGACHAPVKPDAHELEAGFPFTLKFDDAGNWKIIKAHQMSKKELEEER